MRIRINIRIYILAAMLTWVVSSKGQTPSTSYQFRTIGEQQGLTNLMVNSLALDGNGFLWFGTPTGLFRYDGYQFTSFSNTSNSTGIIGNCIKDIASDNKGNLWIANENSVSKYDIMTEQFETFPIKKGDRITHTYQATQIFCAHDGTIRFLCDNDIIYELQPDTKIFTPVMQDIRYCAADASYNFLLVSQKSKSLILADRNGKEICRPSYAQGSDGTALETISALLDNGDGTMYVGSNTGLFMLDTKSQTIRHISHIGNTPMPNQITALHRDKNGLIWIGTNAEELHILDEKTHTVTKLNSDFSHKSRINLNSSTVMTIMEDKNGLIWLGTWQGASVTSLDTAPMFLSITSQDHKDILQQNYISCVARHADGQMIIGSDGGGITFWKYDSIRRTDLWDGNNIHGMANPSILALKVDRLGQIYSGGYNHGLSITSSDYTRTTTYRASPSDPCALESDFVRDILIESDSAVWVLTNGGGMHLLNPITKNIKRIRQDGQGNQPISPYGICIAKAPNNSILWGTYQGLVCYDHTGNHITNHICDPDKPNSLSHNWVYSILADSRGRIWIGTASGLNLFDIAKGTFSQFDNATGLGNACCYSIQEDNNGILWVGTSSGIHKFDPETHTVERTYSTHDGIVSNNFYVNGSLKTDDGIIFFCNMDGLVVFDPQKPNTKAVPPSPTLTSLLIDYKKVSPGDQNSPLSTPISRSSQITLESSQNSFAIQFASLGYIDSESYTYHYRIYYGENSPWQNIGNRREIDFTQTAPGKYILEIIAENSDGLRSIPTRLTIDVLPPWYATTTMTIMMILAAMGAAMLIYRIRTKSLKDQREILRLQVMERTEELSAINDELQSSLQSLRSKTIAIEGSIKYAQTIQQALLNKNTDFQKFFDTSIVYMPKDIVSGDFFWMKACKGMIFASVIDCTGHGVPGAFMSLTTNSILNDIIDFDKQYQPAEILSLLSWRISQKLEQDKSDNKDGMDMAIIRFDQDDNGNIRKMTYSGAKNPAFVIQAGQAEHQILEADRQSIAGGLRNEHKLEKITFRQTELSLQPGDIIYMYSDGIIDIADSRRKRYGRNRLHKLLAEISSLPMDEQALRIQQNINEYASQGEMRDDISVLGLKIR